MMYKLGDTSTTDEEICEMYSLPITLARNPKLNYAVVDAVYKDNIADLIRGGYTRKTATEIADRNRVAALKQVKQVEKM